jgi:glyoxylase-like metal-dependent hydrolase (beta-lactamase superfamily II)
MTNELGIHTIDTAFGRAEFDAAYLIVEAGHGAFIDAGTNHSLPRFLDALTRAGLTPDDVDWVILTHVHLDHAGGTGLLMEHLPNAQLLVHPRGARHMIDPSKLIAGATAVYGAEEIERSYGQLKPVPEHRVVEAEDGYIADLAGRPLLCIDTPGHARHHNAIWDARSEAFFTGDVFGLSYREFDGPKGPFILPTTSPVQFEPDALHASIDRMLSFHPRAMYLTHYDRVEDVERLAEDLHEQIDQMTALARERHGRPDRHAAIVHALGELYTGRARKQGVPLDAAEVRRLLKMDIELNAQGLEIWLDRENAGV